MKGFRDDCGVTLVETMIAVLVAMIGVFSLGAVIFQATATSKNQGTETTRAVIYAQDKMEKLLSLGRLTISGVTGSDFADCTLTTASSQPDNCNTTNITDSGWKQGLLFGGSINPIQKTCPSSGSPNVGYMDFLDVNGQQLPSGGGACSSITPSAITYIRQWQITDMTALSGRTPGKQITVAVYSQAGVNTAGGKPIVILTSIVTNPN
jgi:hypothetical protein